MMFVEMLRVAAQSIRANFFRAFLTMLGIIIGVAAVITMVALGTGAQRAISQQLDSLGSRVLSVGTSQWLHRGVARTEDKLTASDVEALMRDVPSVIAVVIGKSLRELHMPEGSLIALIRRDEDIIVPGGSTVIQDKDRITVIGEPKAMDEFHKRYVSKDDN